MSRWFKRRMMIKSYVFGSGNVAWGSSLYPPAVAASRGAATGAAGRRSPICWRHMA